MGAASRAFVVTLVVFLALAFALVLWDGAQQGPPAESVGNATDVANATTETNEATPQEETGAGGLADATNATNETNVTPP